MKSDHQWFLIKIQHEEFIPPMFIEKRKKNGWNERAQAPMNTLTVAITNN